MDINIINWFSNKDNRCPFILTTMASTLFGVCQLFFGLSLFQSIVLAVICGTLSGLTMRVVVVKTEMDKKVNFLGAFFGTLLGTSLTALVGLLMML